MVSSTEIISFVSINGLEHICGSEGLSKITPWVEYMKIEKEGKVEYDPLHIGFTCQRSADHIAPEISKLYHTIIAGQSAILLNPKPGFCGPNEVTMHCGNFRGDLTECACNTLNRLKYPDLRLIFENHVIQAAERICGSSLKPTQLNIAIFASGGLHGEQILLFRLVAKIKSIFVGTINLFLMDWQYKNNIDQAGTFTRNPSSSASSDWNNFIGKRKDLSQFLNELALCLPSTIKVNGWVFGDADDYIFKARNPAFRHDLLIGADIDGENILFGRIKQATYRIPQEPGILLRRKPEIDTPEICMVPSLTGTCDCESLIVEQKSSEATPTIRLTVQATPTRAISSPMSGISSPMPGVSSSLGSRSISPRMMANSSHSSPAFSSPMSGISSPMPGASSSSGSRSISPGMMANSFHSSSAFSSPMSGVSSPMPRVSSSLGNRSISPEMMVISSPAFSSPAPLNFSVRPIPSPPVGTAVPSTTTQVIQGHHAINK